MKRFLVISSVLILLLTTIHATDPVTKADYLIITHPQLDQGTWLTYLVALQEGRGFQVGVQYVQDGVNKVQKNA